MKYTILTIAFCLIAIVESQAQISAGVYRFSSNTFAAIGSDPDRKVFGEARIATGSRIGLEGTLGYNFVQREEVNFYSGFHLGVKNSNRDDFYLGVPFGLLLKPFSEARNFGFLLEASPILRTDSGSGSFRAGIGIKYTFR
ncbi:outer membrane insertion C- signal [Litoribacter alkaliphilus]|uniref:Outer membrane insertion C- signal n=1 Tax=Litoribacter ruber TaxID=702568 RepID=A0AAP2CI31_9BACT|nr:outer membrane insertion C- signal [Litoribacter alkaliphilus]MBS9523661.1 outer membrane insertion C- signal [Litoribacter alkaliphilus]